MELLKALLSLSLVTVVYSFEGATWLPLVDLDHFCQVETTNAELLLNATGDVIPNDLEITCRLINMPTGLENSTHFEWFLSNPGQVLHDDGDYENINSSEGDATTLRIKDSNRADMATYFCSVTFSPGENAEQRCSPKEVYVYGGPLTYAFDNDTVVDAVSGKDIDINCQIHSLPYPNFTWFKDDEIITESDRIKFTGTDAYAFYGKMTIKNVTQDDAGNYSCLAVNNIAPYNDTLAIVLKVEGGEDQEEEKKEDEEDEEKSVTNALWPFLGIVVEVVVLCVIILIYEMRRSRELSAMEDALATVGANGETKVKSVVDSGQSTSAETHA